VRAASLAIAIACLIPLHAHADEPDPAPQVAPDPVPPVAPPEPTPPPVALPPVAPVPTPDIEALTRRIEELEQKQGELVDAQQDNDKTRERVGKLAWLSRYITVFVDVGAFAVSGNGAGIRSDIGHFYYPKYAGKIPGQWVFMGDPLSTAINSLGEPADTADSRELKNDTIHSGSNPGLIVNSIGLSVGKEVSDEVSIVALAELLPRPGPDILDVELAHIDYRPTRRVNLVISAGKLESVLGVEYRTQDAPRRLGVTPSLICRYICGRPVGIQARLLRGPFSVSAAITDGDNFDERFEPDAAIKSNKVPTGSGHLQWLLPIGQSLELGVSGAFGPQDEQSDLHVHQWHYGFDARLLDLGGFDVTAEFVQGRQQGASTAEVHCGVAQCLSYKGAYLLVDRRVATWLTPYVRVDWRDAVHTNGTEFVYESHTVRATVGVHFEVTSRIVAKLEYTYNRELGTIPQFPDDIITSSIVVATD
jgi:hypothetical protein